MSRCLAMQHRAFVVLTALILMALVGVAITAMSADFSADARRTWDQISDAQLEQLLFAGAAEAPSHLTDKPPVSGESWEVGLPQILAIRGATLRTNVGSVQESGPVSLVIHATLDNRSAEQTLQFRNDAGTWKLVSARFGTD